MDRLSVHLQEQTAVLMELIFYLENTNFGTNRFAKGMICTIKAVLSLQKLLASKYKVPYLLTSRVLQDALENLNNIIR